jgi:hypothetical protein
MKTRQIVGWVLISIIMLGAMAIGGSERVFAQKQSVGASRDFALGDFKRSIGASTIQTDTVSVDPRPSASSTVTLPLKDANTTSIQSAPGNWFYVDEGTLVEDIAYNFLNGHYLIAWSEVDAEGKPDLFVQVFDVYGNPLYSKVKVGERGQSYTHIAYNPSEQEYLIVWDPGYFTLYAQRLNRKGEPLGSKVKIIDNVGMTGGALEVVYNFEENEYFVLFNVLITDWWAVAGQRINENGTLAGSYFWIGEDFFLGGDVVYNSYDDRYLVVGQWGGEGSNGWDIHGQFVDINGNLIGDRFVIDSYENAQESPQVSWNWTWNEYLVIWKDDYQGNDTPDIFGLRLRSDGSIVGKYIPVGVGDRFRKYPNDLAYDWRTGSYLAVWSVWDVDSETYQEERWTYARGIEMDGEMPLAASLLWYPTEGEPSATSAYNGKYIVGMGIDDEIWVRFVKPWERIYLPLVTR